MSYRQFYHAYQQYQDHVIACYMIGIGGYIKEKKLEDLTTYELRELHYTGLNYMSRHIEDFKNINEGAQKCLILFNLEHDFETNVSKIGNVGEVLDYLFDQMRYCDRMKHDIDYLKHGGKVASVLLRYFEKVGSKINIDDKLNIQFVFDKEEVKQIE
jgi:hypothetical protein